MRKLQCSNFKLHFLQYIKLLTVSSYHVTFVKPHLDSGEIIYEKAYNSSFHQKIESVQYNACLAITGAIRGTSKEKLNDELGLESLQLRCWFRKIGYFYKFYKNESPLYLFKLIPLRHYKTRLTRLEMRKTYQNKTIFSKIRFFLQLLSDCLLV